MNGVGFEMKEIMNIEQGILNAEVQTLNCGFLLSRLEGFFPSTFEIPCSIFVIFFESVMGSHANT
jgi:hypothetical protein